MHLEIKSVPFDGISDSSIVSVLECGNIIEIMQNERPNSKQNIVKLSNDEYFLVRDLEFNPLTEEFFISDENIKQFIHHDSKTANFAYMRSICNDFRNMINANLTEPKNAVFITLTYRQRDNSSDKAVPMTDTKRLCDDLRKFIQKITRRYDGVRYLTACEPQKSGSWHAHIIIIFDGKAPFLPSDDVAKWWGQGFVKVEKIKDADNLGAYYVSYLTDMEIPSDSQYGTIKTVEEDGKKVDKRIVKGMRLCFYPPYFHPFRWSRNCIKPKPVKMSYRSSLSIVHGLKPTFECEKVLSDGEYSNTIRRQYFNKLRKGDGAD